ncbi:bifunctional folylpolyglutamate synthase/dihydrofolate synthase [Candidatus Fokinia solitaria]|nr:Mur ligase family protein [Candidatus Fokinia solitaria]
MPPWPKLLNNNVQPGLERIKEIITALRVDMSALPPVVHITGTNGKGSTVAYLGECFKNAKYSTHRYISPHLIKFNERIVIQDREISDEQLEILCNYGSHIIGNEGKFSFFEATTGLALYEFSQKKADVLLLEVGMGGSFDATNVVEEKILNIITPISMDHVEFLGDSLSSIAMEKCGIIRLDSIAVVSWQPTEAANAIISYCESKNVSLVLFGRDWNFEVFDEEIELHFRLPRRLRNKVLVDSLALIGIESLEGGTVFRIPKPTLAGIHQILNAATAAIAMLMLGLLYYKKISLLHISEAVKHAFWPGRMQTITSHDLGYNLPSNVTLIFDGAHNVAGAEMLMASILQLKSNATPLYVVHGRTKGRDIEGFLRFFQTETVLLCVTAIRSEPKSESSLVLYDKATKMGFNCKIVEDVHAGIEECISHAKDKKALILVCGSLYLFSDLKTK